MRKTVLIFFAFCTTAISMANSYQDSITNHQIPKETISKLSEIELLQLSKDVNDVMYKKGITSMNHTDVKKDIVEINVKNKTV